MKKEYKYYLLKENAVPAVLIKVLEAKKILAKDTSLSISEVVSNLGISRSSFYKYKDDIFLFEESVGGKNITLSLQIEDRKGLLSEILSIVAEYSVNILTIHQSIPINGMAGVSLSGRVISDKVNLSELLIKLKDKEGVVELKTLAKE